MNILEYIDIQNAGWESRVKGLHDFGYSWRELGGLLGLDKMTLWRKCSDVLGDEQAAAFEKISGIVGRVWLEPSEELKELGESALIDKRYRTVTQQLKADEWTDLARKEIERGVALVDIAKASGMTRDQANYRLRKK
jgi:hypothetical protein